MRPRARDRDMLTMRSIDRDGEWGEWGERSMNRTHGACDDVIIFVSRDGDERGERRKGMRADVVAMTTLGADVRRSRGHGGFGANGVRRDARTSVVGEGRNATREN